MSTMPRLSVGDESRRYVLSSAPVHLLLRDVSLRSWNLHSVRQRRRITEVPVACRQLTLWLAAIRCEITGL